MKRIITHLKSKPDHHKKRIVFVATFVISAFIFIVWISTLNTRIARELNRESNTSSPFNSIRALFN